jgi:hypothetical protein
MENVCHFLLFTVMGNCLLTAEPWSIVSPHRIIIMHPISSARFHVNVTKFINICERVPSCRNPADFLHSSWVCHVSTAHLTAKLPSYTTNLRSILWFPLKVSGETARQQKEIQAH